MEKAVKKTKKVVKRRLKLKGVLFLLCFFLGIYLIASFLLSIEIQAVYIRGNDLLKDSEVLKLLGLNEKKKFLTYSASSSCKEALSNPYIETCKIKRRLDFKLEVIITENVPLFYYAPESSIVLSNGEKVTAENNFGIPTLLNIVPEKVFTKFVTGLAKVKSDIIRSMSEIEYSPTMAANGSYIDEERFIMSMNDGNTVYINNRKMSILDMYDTIYASIGDVKGTFNCDCDEDTCIFTKYGE